MSDKTIRLWNIATQEPVEVSYPALPGGGNGLAVVPSASETHLGSVGGLTAVADVIFSLDTSAYASGDLLADTQAVAGAFRVTDGSGIMQLAQEVTR